jgi:uncharacterized Zn finger protein (UPF0148 family)
MSTEAPAKYEAHADPPAYLEKPCPNCGTPTVRTDTARVSEGAEVLDMNRKPVKDGQRVKVCDSCGLVVGTTSSGGSSSSKKKSSSKSSKSSTSRRRRSSPRRKSSKSASGKSAGRSRSSQKRGSGSGASSSSRAATVKRAGQGANESVAKP